MEKAKKIKKWIKLPLMLALLCCSACGASGTENSLTATVTSELHAPIFRETASPEWVTEIPTAKDESVKQMVVVAAMGENLTTATDWNERRNGAAHGLKSAIKFWSRTDTQSA